VAGPHPPGPGAEETLTSGFDDISNKSGGPRAVHKIGVLGAGTMGHGIAQVAAGSGFSVAMFDVSAEALARGRQAIERNLNKGIQLGKISDQDRDAALDRIQSTSKLEDLRDVDLIVEAAPENIELKQQLLRDTEVLVRPDAIFATNTSSLSINEIASAGQRPENVIGMHFFNPVHIMRLVEIVVGKETGEDTVNTIRDVAIQFKKEPIVVKDVPGFASSRLGVTLGLEAMRMFEQGVASAPDIDKAMELGYNHPVGPLRLTDLVGLDVRLSIAEYLHVKLGSECFRPPEILRRMVSEGKLGKKSGQGFYKWDEHEQAQKAYTK
jgi:3-hydroxybutyryl-CoA dehydrogenase